MAVLLVAGWDWQSKHRRRERTAGRALCDGKAIQGLENKTEAMQGTFIFLELYKGVLFSPESCKEFLFFYQS